MDEQLVQVKVEVRAATTTGSVPSRRSCPCSGLWLVRGVLIVPGAGLSALSLNLAIFAILNGVAPIEYAMQQSGRSEEEIGRSRPKDDSRSGQVP
jgi:hypothetical protein